MKKTEERREQINKLKESIEHCIDVQACCRKSTCKEDHRELECWLRELLSLKVAKQIFELSAERNNIYEIGTDKIHMTTEASIIQFEIEKLITFQKLLLSQLG